MKLRKKVEANQFQDAMDRWRAQHGAREMEKAGVMMRARGGARSFSCSSGPYPVVFVDHG